MASYSMQFNPSTDNSQRPVQVYHKDGPNISPLKITNEPNSSPAPFFLKRPSISSELASRLIPIDVDIHTKKNMDEHSTNHYDIPGLVLRRGQPFSFTVTFNRDFDAEQHQLYIRLAIGSRSMISKRTQIRLLVDGTPNGNGWSAKKIPTEGEEDKKNNRISLQIDSPSDAIIGKYTLLLEVRPIKKDDKDTLIKQNLTLFLIEVDIYFLFNPWKKDDACALSSSEQIAEYVMNEHGQIYLGSSDEPRSIPWYFGQFERAALHTALTLLDKAQLPPQNRIDPSIILRILSSKICSNPGANNGIFPSSLDVRPVSADNNGHTSSTAILKQYLALNCRSIQGGSGSNWKHAAILCTLSRALGIPCRIATVYNAACRADGTENNDIHWDTKQRPLKRLNSDLICSSHVWNECWMRRNDLPNHEQDWQIVDSTPVQMCDGIRRTGPCPVSSLKKGELGFRWDSPYIHSSINGHKAHWVVYPDGYMELLDVQENTIGNKIITRSLTNEFEPEDITDHYKNPTKSIGEQDNLSARSKNDVNIDLKTPKDIQFGDSIIFELNATNKSNEKRTITTALTICITNGSGQKAVCCYNQPIQTLNLEPDKDDTIQLKISPEQYIKHGQQENIVVKYYIHAQIKETDQTFTRDDNIVFSKDDIIKPILDEDVIEIGKPVFMKIQIANTLSRPLKNGRIYIDGLGINQMLRVDRSFAPKASTILRTKLHPTRVGVSRLYVTFISDNVCSLTQSIPLEIISEPIKKPDEPTGKQDESTEKQEETTGKQGETNEKIDEPLLKNDTGITPKTDEQSEVKGEEKETTLQSNTPEHQSESPASDEQKPAEQPEVKKEDKETPLQSDAPDHQGESPVSEEQKPPKNDEPSEVKKEENEIPLQSADHQGESPVTEEQKLSKTDEPSEVKKEETETSPGHQSESPASEELKSPKTDELSEVKKEDKETPPQSDAPDHQTESPVIEEQKPTKPDEPSDVKKEETETPPPSDTPDHQTESPITEEKTPPKVDEPSEVKKEEKEAPPPSDTPDNQSGSPITDEQKPLTTASPVEGENDDKKTPGSSQTKSDIPPTGDDPAVPPDSTSSLDKDKTSVDNLDTPK